MKNWPFLLGCAVIGIIFGLYYLPKLKDWQAPPEPASQPPAVEKPAVEPKPTVHPVEEIETAPKEELAELDLDKPLPTLEESDPRMEDLLSQLFRDEQLDRIFLLQHFIERFVVMVDNLPRQQLPATHRPFKKIPGRFAAYGKGEELTLDPVNYRRYEKLITLLETVNPQQVMAVYVRLYPLFQEAYVKLGYPNAYFNDRLVAVIDHLFATPTVEDPIRLVRPKYYYQYADPALEALSAGQKMILRTGPANARRIKLLLKSYRVKLVGTPLVSD